MSMSCSGKKIPTKKADNHPTLTHNNSINNPPSTNIPFLQPVTRKITIPLQAHKWHSLKYHSIPANTVDFANNILTIKVHHSASPLIYNITKKTIPITNLSIKGHINKLIYFSDPNKQGEKKLDDFSLRFGLVLLGNKTLNWLEKQFAPAWVIEMHKLAPNTQGISYIHFLNTVNSPTLLNKKRTHPLSKYIKEHYTWLINKTGDFLYTYRFQKPLPTTGLWISTDGDDTKSQFTLTIYSIVINDLTK